MQLITGIGSESLWSNISDGGQHVVGRFGDFYIPRRVLRITSRYPNARVVHFDELSKLIYGTERLFSRAATEYRRRIKARDGVTHDVD